MNTLIACCGNDKGIKHLELLIEKQDWNNIIVVASELIKLDCKKEVEFVLIDTKNPLTELSLELRQKLRGKLTDFEVGVNLFSGTGKEHMALMSALIQSGIAIRFVAITPNGVKEI